MHSSDTSAHRPSPAAQLIAGGILAGAALFTFSKLTRAALRRDLRGKVVALTGGSRGLGLVLARQLLHRGAKVAICSRAIPTLQHAAAELRKISPDGVLAVPADVSRPYDIELFIAAVRERFGRIDVLVNNVANIQVGPAQLMTEDDYRSALDATFWSAYRTTEAVLPEMRARGEGAIVNISSVGGLIPAPHLAPYVTAKHALVGYSRSMHNELARDGIRVTTVTPGLMRTGSPRNATFKGNARAEYAWFKIADSLPFTSIDADRAASQIVDAIEHGDADLTITLSAKVGARVQSLFPNVSARFATLLNRLLPRPAGSREESHVGREVESGWTRSPLTAMTDRAARMNNQYAMATPRAATSPQPDPPRGHRPPGEDMPSVSGEFE